jgi:hypothetical protein
LPENQLTKSSSDEQGLRHQRYPQIISGIAIARAPGQQRFPLGELEFQRLECSFPANSDNSGYGTPEWQSKIEGISVAINGTNG